VSVSYCQRTGKVCYENKRRALLARRVMLRKRSEAQAFEAYDCEHCGTFHLGRKRLPIKRSGY